MRRAIALTLLALFSWMLMAPLFAPDAEAALPPCCRRHGKHHCMMQRLLAMSGQPGGPAAVQERCPCQPSGGGAVQSRMYAAVAARRLQTGLAQPARLPERRETPHQSFFIRNHPKRGPPILSA
jgi:hypothetical protein